MSSCSDGFILMGLDWLLLSLIGVLQCPLVERRKITGWCVIMQCFKHEIGRYM